MKSITIFSFLSLLLCCNGHFIGKSPVHTHFDNEIKNVMPKRIQNDFGVVLDDRICQISCVELDPEVYLEYNEAKRFTKKTIEYLEQQLLSKNVQLLNIGNDNFLIVEDRILNFTLISNGLAAFDELSCQTKSLFEKLNALQEKAKNEKLGLWAYNYFNHSEKSEVLPQLDKRQIKRVINHNVGHLKSCYNAILREDPKLNGTVAVKFKISSDGEIIDAKIHDATIINEDFKSCLIKQVKKWRFPKSIEETVVVYPFIFAVNNFNEEPHN